MAGYQDLEKVNETLIKGNEELKFVICLGMGGLVDLSAFLDLSRDGDEAVECWIVDGRRPWNLYNVYAGGKEGDDDVAARGGKVVGGRHGVGESVGGIKCFDDGDIAEEMAKDREAFKELIDMPDIDDDSDSEDEDEEDEEGEGGVSLDADGEANRDTHGRKRKSSEDQLDESEDEDGNRSRRPRRDSDAVFISSGEFWGFMLLMQISRLGRRLQSYTDTPCSHMPPRDHWDHHLLQSTHTTYTALYPHHLRSVSLLRSHSHPPPRQ